MQAWFELSDIERDVYTQRAQESHRQEPPEGGDLQPGLDERELAGLTPYGIGSSVYPLSELRIKDGAKDRWGPKASNDDGFCLTCSDRLQVRFVGCAHCFATHHF
jgi:hypothetical protein